MQILGIDWIIIVAYFVVSIGIGIFMSKRAGRSTGDFFLSGRKLPWYIAGTSMVATTFAADTPLAVTELVADNGIAGNWLWWNMLFGGMLTVFFFARLWRRSGIMTDCEFVAIRYSGKSANFLRAFRAIYIGIFMNSVVIAWVNLAMVKIFSVLFPDLLFFGHEGLTLVGIYFSSHLLWVGGLMLFVAIYSSLSGLWGVSITDSFQFVMAMTGSILLAVFALRHVDIQGVEGLRTKLPESAFHFLPGLGQGAGSAKNVLQLSVTAFVAYLGVQWWASWYPGAEPGGGGYVAQRIMSAKDEKHSLLATLWFNIAHFALRPWPWIIVALVSLVLYPDLPPENKGAGYIMAIKDLMPAGLMGLMLAAFLAAYMSTIASQTVWGTSYIINDLFKPFIKPNGSEKYYVKVSRITTFILLIFALMVTSQLEKISDAWKFVLAASGGIGLVLILRWFWWRINAWSEISAMLAPYPLLLILIYKFNYSLSSDYEMILIYTVIWASFVWLLVTFLTRPSDQKVLESFYRKVHPGGWGWKKVYSTMTDVRNDTGYGRLFINWVAGCLLVMFFLFGIGKWIFFGLSAAWWYFAIGIACLALIFVNMRKLGWEKIAK